MPTDESYLDSLLNGLNSDGNKPEDDNRFSVYKKRKKTETDENAAKPKTEEKPEAEETSGIEDAPKFEDVPEVEDTPVSLPKTEKKPVAAEKPATKVTAGEIENYNIFDDYDDAVIDEIISNELSEEGASGELFAVSEDSNNDIFIENDTPVSDSDVPEEDKIFTNEGKYTYELNGNDDSIASEEGDALDSLFGDLNHEENSYTEISHEEKKEENEEDAGDNGFDLSSFVSDDKDEEEKEKSEDDDMNFDGFDFFEGVSKDPVSESQMETHLADEVFNIEADEAEAKPLNALKNKAEQADSEDIFALKDAEGEPSVFYAEEEEQEEEAGEEDNIEDNTESSVSDDLSDLFGLTASEPESNDFNDNNDAFGDLYDTGSVPTESNEAADAVSDEVLQETAGNDEEEAFDFLNSGSEEPQEYNQEKSEEIPEENADNYVAEYNDPMEGFTFNAEENTSGNNGLSSMLGNMGVDSFDEDDLAALDNLLNEIDLEKPEEDKPVKPRKSAVDKEKLPWYIQLFGNVKIPEDKIKPEPTQEEIDKKKAEKAEAKKALKEAKKAEKDEKKKAAAEAKALKARQTAEEKELARKKKLEQASALILEDVGNTTKLNKWGILVIFALFIGVVAVTVSAGITLSYNIGVRQASKLFNNALIYQDVNYYTKAYDKVYGLDIEDEDADLYDKILTVNYVNIHLTAFHNHEKLNDYRGGLNDLFKGLLRFRKWFAHASDLGAQDDMYFVRREILNTLQNVYGIDESEALFVLEHYDLLKETYGEYDANLYYTRYIYETVDRLGLGTDG